MALADAMLPSINTFSSNQILDEKQADIIRVSSLVSSYGMFSLRCISVAYIL